MVKRAQCLGNIVQVTTMRRNSERLIWEHLWQHLRACDRSCSLRLSLSEAPYFSWKMLEIASWNLFKRLRRCFPTSSPWRWHLNYLLIWQFGALCALFFSSLVCPRFLTLTITRTSHSLWHWAIPPLLKLHCFPQTINHRICSTKH